MELQERIIQEATRQFFSFGIRNVTMDDIAVSLGISKRTVYEQFQDKGTLVQVCLDKLKKKEEEETNAIITTSANVIEIIFKFLVQGIQAINSVNPVFFRDMEKLYPSKWKMLENEVKAKRLELVSTMLNKGITEGLFRKDLNVEIVCILFQEQINLLASDSVFPRNRYNHAEVFQNIIINFARGISTKEGIAVIENLMPGSAEGN